MFRLIMQKYDNLQYNTLGCWVAGTIVKHLMFQVLFFYIISCKILCKTPFNLYFYFFIHNFIEMKIKSFECPKPKPATHCFTPIPRIAHFLVPWKNRVTRKSCFGTVLNIQLTWNSPTNAYISQKLSKCKPR